MPRARASKINFLQGYYIRVKTSNHARDSLGRDMPIQPDAAMHVVGHHPQPAHFLTNRGAPADWQRLAAENIQDGGTQRRRAQEKFRFRRNPRMSRQQSKSAGLFEPGPPMCSAFYRKSPGMAFRMPAKQREIARVRMMAQAHQVSADFRFPSVRVRQEAVRSRGHQSLSLEMVPHHLGLRLGVQHTRNISFSDQPLGENALLLN